MGWVVLAVMMGLAVPLWAQDVSEAVLNKVKSDPAPFLTLAANLIHGFGTERGIDGAGVDRFVALERAAARATALRRLQLADLDFDGAVTRAEMAVLTASVAAKSRGRLWALHEEADDDSDDTVSAAEMLTFGRAEAIRDFSAMDEALVRSVLTFDGNSDGYVSLDEVKSAVAALGT